MNKPKQNTAAAVIISGRATFAARLGSKKVRNTPGALGLTEFE